MPVELDSPNSMTPQELKEFLRKYEEVRGAVLSSLDYYPLAETIQAHSTDSLNPANMQLSVERAKVVLPLSQAGKEAAIVALHSLGIDTGVQNVTDAPAEIVLEPKAIQRLVDYGVENPVLQALASDRSREGSFVQGLDTRKLSRQDEGMARHSY